MWSHCLDIAGRKSRLEKFDDVYDHADQGRERETGFVICRISGHTGYPATPDILSHLLSGHTGYPAAVILPFKKVSGLPLTKTY